MSALSSITPASLTRPFTPSASAVGPATGLEKDTSRPIIEGDRLTPAQERSSAPAVDRAERGSEELSADEQRQVDELKARDAEVRAHEQAHVAAAGPHYRGGPTYSYRTGPDGQRYAVGGSVQIDTSPVPGDPAATIAKAQQVRRAALAPAEPSTTDFQVAAAASRMEAEARAELTEQSTPPADSTPAPATNNAVAAQADAEGEERDREAPGGRIDVFA